MTRRKGVIIAGSKAQADYWARQLGFGPHDLTYIGSPAGSRGRDLTGCPGYLVGTWRQRPDIGKLIDALIPTGVTLIDGEEMVPPHRAD